MSNHKFHSQITSQTEKQKDLDVEISTSRSVWCAIRDLNPYGLPPEPKSGASANSANRAYMCVMHDRKYR